MSEYIRKRTLEEQTAGLGLFDPPPTRSNLGRVQARLHHDVDTSQQQEDRLNRKIRGIAGEIIAHLRTHGRRTRQEIADETGILLQSVCAAVAGLRREGFVVELEEKRDGRHLLEVTP